MLKGIKNFLKTLTVVLFLISFILPFSVAYLNAQALTLSEKAEDKKVKIEIVNKDGVNQVKTGTIKELESEATFEHKQFPKIKTNFTQTDFIEIDEKAGVIYDHNRFATLDKQILENLDYNSQQIADIQAMIDFYNTNPVQSFTIKILTEEKEGFGVAAKANACEKEFKYHSTHWWGWRYFVNDCMVEHINLLTDIKDIIPFLGVFIKCNPVLCGVIALSILLQKFTMNWRNDECGKQGVYFDIEWTGDVYFTKIC